MLRMVLDSSVAGFVEMELEDEDEDEDDKDDDGDDDDDADNDDDDEIEEEEEEEEEETVLPSGLYFFRVNLCFLVWDGRSGEFDREREEKLLIVLDTLKTGDCDRDRGGALDLAPP
jgi:hypothetical protein